MAKRRRSPKRRRSSKKRRYYPILSSLIFFLIGIVGGLGYYWYHLLQQQDETVYRDHKSSIASIKKREEEVLRAILSEVEDYRQNQASSSLQSVASSSSVPASISKPLSKPRVHVGVKRRRDLKKPKLAIIIDDVAFGYQVRALRALGLRLNLSFFPPSPKHPDTPVYAKRVSHYMVHLPLEAKYFSREEEDTLRTTSSYATIERVIAKIRKEFPKARYINNHTGSRFTADMAAMRRLVSVLDRYGFSFVDSRTTPQTKVPRLMEELGRRYLHRDVFIDNELDVDAIKRQLKKAVQIAMNRGWAIAIGHPHKKTIQALRESKGILKKVRLVYIEEL